MALTTYKAKMVSCIIIIVTPLSLSTSVCVCVFAEWLHIYRVTGQDSNIQDWRPPILPRLECIFPSNRTTKCAVSTTISYASLSDTSKENCHIWLCPHPNWPNQKHRTKCKVVVFAVRHGDITSQVPTLQQSSFYLRCGEAAVLFFLSILMEQFFFFIAAVLPLVLSVSLRPMPALLLAWIVTLVIYDARILMWYQATDERVNARSRQRRREEQKPTQLSCSCRQAPFVRGYRHPALVQIWFKITGFYLILDKGHIIDQYPNTHKYPK